MAAVRNKRRRRAGKLGKRPSEFEEFNGGAGLDRVISRSRLAQFAALKTDSNA